MPRWEHGSEERLKQAAMELFDEQGFENTSAVQIAHRARVTTRTFFRYFPDKQSILFVDADLLRTALLQGIHDAQDVTEPLEVVTRVLVEFDWEGLGSKQIQRRRAAMITANPELLERELNKERQMAVAFGDALRQRGVEPRAAELAARVGIQVFQMAYRLWLNADEGTDVATTMAASMSTLAAIVPAVSPPS
ncbi:TetR family transcriptional regulator [Mycolicibacterium sp. P1-18]|uniref:TetR family transcriptional regulator n=1 Tax=Mycolicibacterium sp. P1-18 TaxID=2024615 RepID=UPI0011F263C3|nr:TetR family transcriptional regulator [Mycolicibacterium sp. P1-18]KAA0095968.1 TetR family transcriptional regulator [Mycolicibacterium sp. P1-18]